MDIIKIISLSLGSLVILFLLTKLMGNKEMSQLTMFDYIVGITIGSIAAEMSTSLENNFIEPVVAMLIYGIVSFSISFFCCKSLNMRRFFSGKAKILLDNGKLYRKNFKSAKLDLNEFLMECRINGYFNLSDIQTAILEPNGRISFLPKTLKRPATPEDLNLSPSKENIVYNIVLDGVLLKENLEKSGNNINWLENNLKKQGISDIKKIFLATCDNQNNLSVYVKLDKKNKHDFFE